MATPVLNQDFFASVDPVSGLDFSGMNDEERAAIEETFRQVQEHIAKEQAEARYFQRQDNMRLVKTQSEYAHCARKGIALKIVEREEAEALLAAEDQRGKERKEKRERRKARRRK